MFAVGFRKALHAGAFFVFGLFAATALAATESAQVRHALDGDTFILANGRHVRLIGINAPELGKDGAPDQPLAAQARTRLAALIERRRVTLQFEREREDHYGRLLAHVRLSDGNSAEEILLREGLAWAVAIPPNIGKLPEHLAAENEARAVRRGVWGEPAYAPTPASDLTAKDTGFRFVEGTVIRLTQRHRVIYLDLAPRVALLIPRDNWNKYFDGNPRMLVGRRVVARGWLTEKCDRDVAVTEPRTQSRGRLHLRVPHPAMLTWPDQNP